VLLREPRKPHPPDVAHESVLPWRSVIVTIVLLNEACTCAIASVTCRFAFLRALAAGEGAPACGFLSSDIVDLLSVQVPAPRRPGQALPGGAFSLTAALRGPLRVRAFVRVRWPRSGNPLR